LQGQIVGINEIGVGLGGAIPADLAQRVAGEIIAHGSVRRSWIGMELQPLLKSIAGDRGVLVAGVLDKSPAAKAGVRPGDVLLSFDERPLFARFKEQLPDVNRTILETPVGKTVPVVVLRDSQELALELTTEPRANVRGKQLELKAWGIAASEITVQMAKELRREPSSGALASSVRAGGAASEAKPPLHEGDVIVEVAGRPVKSLGDLASITESLVEGKDEKVPALVTYERRGERILTVVSLGPDPDQRSREVRKAWFPASIQVLTTPLAEALGLAGKTGVRVTQVFPQTTVGQAGIQVGDIIVAIDGERIPASQPEHLQVFYHMVRQRRIGAKATLTLYRDGTEMKIDVELPVRPPEANELPSYKDEAFDFSAREPQFRERVDNQWPAELKGVLVASVEPGGWAAFAGVRSGDLLLAVDAKLVESVADLKSIMQDIAKRRPSHVTFHVRRGIRTLFVEMEPAWPSTP
jgi:serine protease Do